MNKKKEFVVSGLEKGTVIDHIPSEVAFKVAELLNLFNDSNTVVVATNLSSKTLKKKGVIKVADRSLSTEEVNKISLIAPTATLNIIKNYEVVEKMKAEVPDTITSVVNCSNPNCITNVEGVKTKFFVVEKNPALLRCNYCERSMGHKEIVLK